MVAASIAGKQVIVRELRPQDMKFELDGLQQAEAIAIARLMAGVAGRATADNSNARTDRRGYESSGRDTAKAWTLLAGFGTESLTSPPCTNPPISNTVDATLSVRTHNRG
jgi:hypothetical protein